MFVRFFSTDLAAPETLLVTLPESVGLLAIGISLVLAAVLTRSFLARGNRDKNNGEATKKA